MPLTDIVVLVVIGAATSASAALLRRRGVRGRALQEAVWLSFYGIVLIAMMMAHNLEILYRAFADRAGLRDTASLYDFRLYSLLLLGILLIGAGVVCLRAVPGVSRGTASAREAAVRASVFVLAIVAPLIPIQVVFGSLLTVVSVASALMLTRHSRAAEAVSPSEEAKPARVVRA